MPRRRTLSAACAAALALLPLLAGAQVATDQFQRRFPEQARRGVLRVATPPEILLDGKPERLSPGSRIRTASTSTCSPHSLAWSCSHHQRPALSSSPSDTARVQGAQPMLGKKRSCSSL